MITNEPQNYQEVQLQKWVYNYYAESEEPNYTDNIIYNNCLEVLFEYSYTKNDTDKYFKLNDDGEWEFISKDSLDHGVGIKYLKLTSVNPNPRYDDPQQTAIKYEYLTSKHELKSWASTGVVENYWNIAIHNPRGGFFLSLFSFPWPAIKFPIKKNLRWDWKYAYDSSLYSDHRFFTWDGFTEMQYSYEYMGEEMLELDFGNVEVSKFVAIGTDGQIINQLVYYFNSNIGFVKQIFQAHDGSTVQLYATAYKNNCE